MHRSGLCAGWGLCAGGSLCRGGLCQEDPRTVTYGQYCQFCVLLQSPNLGFCVCFTATKTQSCFYHKKLVTFHLEIIRMHSNSQDAYWPLIDRNAIRGGACKLGWYPQYSEGLIQILAIPEGQNRLTILFNQKWPAFNAVNCHQTSNVPLVNGEGWCPTVPARPSPEDHTPPEQEPPRPCNIASIGLCLFPLLVNYGG